MQNENYEEEKTPKSGPKTAIKHTTTTAVTPALNTSGRPGGASGYPPAWYRSVS